MATQHSSTVSPATASAGIEIRPLSVHIGAEIHGLDLTRSLSTQQVRTIHAALLEWKVVFFRDQTLTHAQHIEFARRFGDPTPGHVVFGGDASYPEIYSIAKYRTANQGKAEKPRRPWSGWHADITAAINPPYASILRGDVVPPYGGDTHWIDLAAAYRALSPKLRGFVDGLRGVHAFEARPGAASSEYADKVESRKMVSEHPIVTVHPETGERVLYISPSFLKSIAELSMRESEVLLELLWEHAVRSEYMVRFKWEPGSVAFWDNRCTIHLAPSDIFDTDFDRQFYRVTLMGETPRGVDGRESRAIEGEPIAPVSG